MRKLLGILLVLGSSAAMGLENLRKKRLRILKLKEMAALMDVMEREIRERLMPLDILMQRLASREDGNTAPFAAKVFEAMQRDGVLFSEAWEYGLASYDQEFLLEVAGKELTELGELLGRFSAERQCEALRHVSERLKRSADELDGELRRSEKLYLGGSLSAGAVAVLILV